MITHTDTFGFLSCLIKQILRNNQRAPLYGPNIGADSDVFRCVLFIRSRRLLLPSATESVVPHNLRDGEFAIIDTHLVKLAFEPGGIVATTTKAEDR